MDMDYTLQLHNSLVLWLHALYSSHTAGFYKGRPSDKDHTIAPEERRADFALWQIERTVQEITATQQVDII